jgi:hypothetical protein
MKTRKKKHARSKRVVTTETTRIKTEPVVEIRRPATLAQALTEPGVAVVKPKVTRIVHTSRRTA